MNDKMKRIDHLESVLSNNESQSKAETLAELRAQGIDTDNFIVRVKRVVQEQYTKALRDLATTESANSPPTFLAGIAKLSRDAMLDLFGRLQRGEFGNEYRQMTLARCRNKDASQLSDDELRSWLQDIGDILGEPDRDDTNQ